MAGTQVMSVAAGNHVNGYPADGRPGTPQMLEQLAQFEKLIKLRDDVVEGIHPTLKLPPSATANEDVAGSSSNLASANLSGPPMPSGMAHGAVTNTSISHLALPSNSAAEPSKLHSPSQPTSHVSDFDPILLTKSEPVKRAELRLERQRVEKKLEDQIHRKRIAQKRETEQDSLPDFDVSDVLIQAQELVKPLSASEVIAANENNSPSNSVDDTTFYSSQHNESDAEERADLRATKPCRFFFEGKCLKGNRCDWSHDPAFKSKMGAPGDDDQEQSGRRPLRPSPTYGPRDLDAADPAMEDGEINEGSYSPPRNPPPVTYHSNYPPPAAAPPPQPDHPGHMRSDSGFRRAGAEDRPVNMHERRRSGRHSPAADTGRIIQNTITSPAAPQPARVSPLAVAKFPRIERVRQVAEELSPKGPRRVYSSDNSPSSAQASASRKRQRRQSPVEGNRNVAQRRYEGSPEAYIKPEPTSPAPLSELPAREVIHVEPTSPVYYRQVPTSDNRIVYEEIRPERTPIEQPYVRRLGSPMDRRAASGPGGVYEPRREPELRRVVSARQQLRVASPQVEYYPAAPQREYYAHSHAPEPHRRPASRAYVLADQPPASYRASVQPQITSRQGPPGSPPSPGVEPDPPGSSYREIPRMAPAQRTIVVDKYGNQYYESTSDYTPVPRESVAPEHYYPREMAPPAPHPRASLHPEPVRGPTERQIQHISQEPTPPRYVEYREMQPPPRAASRAPSRAPVVYERTQNGEYGPVVEYARDYQPRYEEVPQSRMGPARTTSAAPQRPIYIDDREPVYERSYRVPTAQPEMIRYIDAPRAGTVVRQLPAEGEERVQYREPPRQVYQYVEGPGDPYVPRYGGSVIVDEHGRRLQRM